MEKFKKLLHSKKAKHVSETEKSAKMDVLKDLKKHAMDMMGEKLGHLKKVTVASDSKEGMEKGLDKAKELIEKTPSDSEEVECPECEGKGCPVCGEESVEHEASETPEEETTEHETGEESEDESEEEMTEEELDAKIKELMKKKEELKFKK